MNAQTAPEDSADEILERRIHAAHAALIAAPTRTERIRAWEDMRLLISSRSVWAIARMEAEKGLKHA